MEKLTLTTEDKTFTHTWDKDWNGKETYEISEVLKSLKQRFAMNFLGLLTGNEMPGIRKELKQHTTEQHSVEYTTERV